MRLSFLSLALIFLMHAGPLDARERIDLSGPGWRLWLDSKASFEEDPLFLPPVDLEKLPLNPPTNGWGVLVGNDSLAVEVPGTVEEYLWEAVGDYRGVSWWCREFDLPPRTGDPCVKLLLEAVRLRCEIFVNERLVGYDLIGNTPFEADATEAVRWGGKNFIALRITDPGGNFDWVDYDAHVWGKHRIPASHGFGGVTGRVAAEIRGPVHIDDLFVMNRPEITRIDVKTTIRNSSGETKEGTLRLEWMKGNHTEKAVFPPGESTFLTTLGHEEARIWDLDHPHLYTLRASIDELGDAKEQAFGFRWFEADRSGEDAVFRLNGRRIVLRSAISWGFWPVNGIFPTPGLAEKHVASARALGLNMLHFHRGIGWPIVLDEADRQGLLYYEEPGGYVARGGDAFTRQWAREKLLRMVKRDRSHPSLVIYNMINEQAEAPDEGHRRDMRDAHALDPTRIITYVSGWSEEGEDPKKLHMLPHDETQHVTGWFDFHHAPGPGVYLDSLYNGPEDHYLRSENRNEIVFHGEEGAIAAPPRLARLHEHYTTTGKLGWDGRDYLEWYEAYRSYLEEKDLEDCFPSIDDLTLDLGSVPYFYQGRIIENIRINDRADGYVINGYECEKLENHSGIVDPFRLPKGKKEILAYYNQPLYLALKATDLVVPEGGGTRFDVYLVNETGLEGTHRLEISLKVPKGGTLVQLIEEPVEIRGGETYSQLLMKGIGLEPAMEGYFEILARLDDRSGKTVAYGQERIFAVKRRKMPIPENGAILELKEKRVTRFLKKKNLELPPYRTGLPELDYLVTARSFQAPATPVWPRFFRTKEGEEKGLKLEFFKGRNFEEPMGSRRAESVFYNFREDPMRETLGGEEFSLRFTGSLVPEASGRYILVANADDGVRLWLRDELLIDRWSGNEDAARWKGVNLEAGKNYPFRLDYFQGGEGAGLSLSWILPTTERVNLKNILHRVKEDGTILFVLEDAAGWASKIRELGELDYRGEMKHGKAWLGGGYFVRRHPFFQGLPVNRAMNWEYQVFTRYDNPGRGGLMLKGEEAVVASVTGHEHRVATAVGIVPYGKGRIVFSTLAIAPHLNSDEAAAEVARAVFLNYLAWVEKR